MADDVVIDLGGALGTATFAADLISGVEFLRQKIALGPNGTNTADLAGRDLGNSEGGAAYVDPRPLAWRFPATQATYSAITGMTAASYSSAEGIGTTTTITGAARQAGGSGLITRASFVDRDDEGPAFTMLLWATAPSWSNDAAAGPADADGELFIGMISVATSDWKDLGGLRVAQFNLAIPYQCAAASTGLVGTFYSDGSYSPAAATDLRFMLLGYVD